MSTRRRTSNAWLLSLALASAACSDSAKDTDETRGDASSNTDAQTGDAGDGSSDGQDGGSGGDVDTGTGGGSDAGTAQTEVCDGEDNDGNGIIDDVDAEGDGVCDCLNIATIGEIGPWSNGGNVFRDWLNSRSPIGADELGNQVLTPDLLRKYQVIVVLYAGTVGFEGGGRTLAAHHVFSPDEVAAFEAWIKNGGGVMTTAGYTYDESAEVMNVNRLLSPLGAGYSTTKLDVQGFVTSWQPHLLTEGVTRIRTDNGVEPDGAMATTLAHAPNNHVALQISEPEQGRVVVWGDEWITYDSEWADSTDQQVSRLWLNMLKYLSPPKVCQVVIPPLL